MEAGPPLSASARRSWHKFPLPRETPAITVCRTLLQEKALLSIYDPAVSEGSIRAGLTDCDSDSIAVVTEPYEAASEAHAVVVLTDWEVFKTFDYERIYSHMKKPAFLFDGRNLLNLKELSNIGYKVCGVGVG